LDGATFDIIRPLVDAGRLPAFARMMKEGCSGPLASVPGYRSAAAWTSFQTGTTPGRHGVFEFYEYLPESYSLQFIHGGARHGASLWKLLSEKEKQVVVINVPMTYPAEAVNGVLVAGLDCPSPRSPGFTHPPPIAEELRQQVGEYMIEPGLTGSMIGGRIDEAVSLIEQEFEQKMRVARHLHQTRSWDLFVVVLRSLDAVQHCFWKFADPSHPDHCPSEAKRYGKIIANSYERLDRYLGEWMETLDPTETTLLVMSDHGFGPKNPAAGQLNYWLHTQSLLKFRNTSPQQPRGLLGDLYRKVIGRTSRNTKEWMWQKFPWLRNRVQSRLCFANIDWHGTKAYSDSLFANVRINLKGRERDGIVPPGGAHRELVEDIQRRLHDLRDSRTGNAIVAEVLRADQAYPGPFEENAPDLIIHWREDTAISGIRMPDGESTPAWAHVPIPGEDHRFISGDHRRHGVFLGRGADLHAGMHVDNAHLVDLMPTILHQMGLPVPEGLDGAVLQEIFTSRFNDEHPIRYESPDDSGSPGQKTYGEDETAAIHERLRDLGYVE
jgi:predicted AlkP superfamily phosphohydrolase/phosphomutase